VADPAPIISQLPKPTIGGNLQLSDLQSFLSSYNPNAPPENIRGPSLQKILDPEKLVGIILSAPDGLVETALVSHLPQNHTTKADIIELVWPK
jgi:hypothetical protein